MALEKFDRSCVLPHMTNVEDRALTGGEGAEVLRARCAELEALTANIPGGVHQCLDDAEFSIVSVSGGFLGLFGYARDELRVRFGDRFAGLILPGDRDAVFRSLREQLARGDSFELEYRVRHSDGNILWVLDKGRLVVRPDGVRTLFCVLLDITRQKEERDELRLSLERHQIILDQCTDIIFEWDIARDHLTFSSNWSKKFGYEPITVAASRNIPDSGDILADDLPLVLKVLDNARAGGSYAEAEARIRNSSGGYIWCRIRATTQYDDGGRPMKVVGVILDIDEEKKRSLKLMERADMDSLTGLLNKRAGRVRVEELLGKNGASGVLLIIDLDDFKLINDRYGHLCGDTVLTDMADALKRQFRAGDVKSRIGGDEFMVYMPGITVSQATKKAADIVEAARRIHVYGKEGHVSCSIGAAACPEDAVAFQALYKCADMALYRVKNSGKGKFAFHGGAAISARVSLVGVPLESHGRSAQEQLPEQCIRMLYRAMDPATAVNRILELVGTTYDVSRVYVFESAEEGLLCNNTFEWCNHGVQPEIEQLQELSYMDDLADYASNFDDNGVFYCDDVDTLHPALRAILHPQGIRSLLQCAIMDDGQFKGVVGFDECRENRGWTREQIDTLILIANVLSIFLLKLRLKELVNPA